MGYPLLGTRETWVISTVPLPLFSRLTPHASRSTTPDQRGQVVRRPSPAGYSDTNRRIAKNRTGPDLDERPFYIQYVTGRTIPSENPSFFPRSPPSNR